MPRLPTFQDLGQRPEPQPGTAVQSYRATTGQEEAPGLAMSGVGDVIERAVKVEMERQDTTKVEDAWNQYKNAAMDLTSGEKGVLRLKGGDAVKSNMMQTTQEGLTASRKAIEGTLRGDEQLRRFKERADTTDLGIKHQVLNHLVAENDTYRTTTMKQSTAIDAAEVANDPLNDAVFLRAQSNQFAQADAYLKHIGSDNPKANELYKKGLTDTLWESRIESLMSRNKPIEASRLFRDNSESITSWVIREKLRKDTEQAALVMHASLRTDADLAEVITKQIEQNAKPEARAPIEQGPAPSGPLTVRQHNPGALTDPKTGEIRTFATREEGERALDTDLRAKLSGQSPAYRRRFGAEPVTPARLAETWAPAAAKGNSAESTANYGKAIAKSLGIGVNEQIFYSEDSLTKVKSAITAFEAGGSGAGLQTVAAKPAQDFTTNSSVALTGRQLAAQEANLLARIEPHATELYGKDVADPARMAFVKAATAAVKSKLALQVDQLTKGQKQYSDDVGNRIMGIPPENAQGQLLQVGGVQGGGPGRAGAGGMMITNLPQLQREAPEEYRKFMLLDATGREHAVHLMEAAAKQQIENGREKGNPALYNEYRNRIYKSPDSPDKINWPQTITQDPRFQENGLSGEEWSRIRTDLKNAATDEGRSQEAVMRSGGELVKAQFGADNTLTMFGTQPQNGKPELAYKLWQWNADKVIGLYKQQNKDIRELFNPDPQTPAERKVSLVTPEARAPFIVQAGGAASQAEALATAAQAKATQSPDAPPQADKSLTTTEQMNAFLKANAASPIVLTPKGEPSQNPFYQPSAQPAPSSEQQNAPAAQQPAAGAVTFDANGKLTGPTDMGGVVRTAAAAQPVAKAADDIPILLEGPAPPKGSRTEEQKIASAARLQDFFEESIKTGLWVLTGPVQAVRLVKTAAGEFIRGVKALSPSEEERAITGFRSVLKQGNFRANEDTVVMLNNFLASKKGTETENVKAQKMLRVIANKLGVEPTP